MWNDSLDDLLTEQLNPRSEGIDARPTEEILRIINEEDQQVAYAVGREIPQIARAVDAIVERIRRGGRLFYIGAGTSGRLGVLDAAECPPTFQVPPDLVVAILAGGAPAMTQAIEAAEDDPEAGARDLLARGFCERDSLVGIAASGRTPYVLGAIQQARALGALTIGLSCNPGSPLARQAEIPITPVVGPEIIAGSTRMKAGTATKLVLNMISTAVMIRLGYVFGNLMVNVRPVNTKLAARARRIIRLAAGVDDQRARALLEEAEGNVRVAILMERCKLSRDSALRLLEAAEGRLSVALKMAESNRCGDG